MNITIANKKLTEKPQTNIEKSLYFKDLTFKTANFNLNVFKEIIENQRIHEDRINELIDEVNKLTGEK